MSERLSETIARLRAITAASPDMHLNCRECGVDSGVESLCLKCRGLAAASAPDAPAPTPSESPTPRVHCTHDLQSEYERRANALAIKAIILGESDEEQEVDAQLACEAARAELDAWVARLIRCHDLLVRIRGWDQLPETGDGPYWIGEIDAALSREGDKEGA